MAKKNSAVSNAQKLGIGVGLTTAAVAAVGAYFLYGSKDAPKNRKMVKSWALKAKGEVLEALEKAEHITEEEFSMLVDGVAKTYGSVQKLSKSELDDFKSEMSDNWKRLVKSGAAKAIVKGVAGKKPAKKVTKKATKTVAKKTPAKKASVKKTPTKVAAKK